MAELPSYPPELDASAHSSLVESLTDYALSHGITVRPQTQSEGNHLASHVPVTLFPTPLPRKNWEHALKIQRLYNLLYARVSNDPDWLGRVLSELCEVDEFIRRLLELYKQCAKDGIVQKYSLSLYRSDYMIHSETSELKQVEFNTISCSFGGLSEQVTKLHQYLFASGAYGPEATLTRDNLPDNPSARNISKGLAKAHEIYNYPNSIILFVVQNPEPNVFDQRRIEYHLLENRNIQSHRMTLEEVSTQAKLENQRLYVPTRGVMREVSVVYYRCGYGPEDYILESQWEARRLLEISLAIKCPTILAQMTTCKKVQQALTSPDALERFLEDTNAAEVRNTFMKMYPLDTSPEGLEGRRLAVSDPENYVLKPQRDGGGHNIYKSSIPKFLRSIPEDEYKSYTLMELIPTAPHRNSIMREGKVTTGEVISELGVFGTILWDSSGYIEMNEEAGWLLRSKLKGVDEGGVVAGFGCLDSVYLI